MHHIHLQVIGKSPNQIDDYNSNKNIDSYSSFNELIDVVQQYGNKKYIYKINNAEFPKFKLFQWTEF